MCSFSLFNEEEVGVGGEQRTREGEADQGLGRAGPGPCLVAGSPRQGKGCSALVEPRGALGLDSEASSLCAQAPVMAIGLFRGPCDKRPHPPGELCSFSAFLRRLWWEGGVSAGAPVVGTLAGRYGPGSGCLGLGGWGTTVNLSVETGVSLVGTDLRVCPCPRVSALEAGRVWTEVVV